MTIRVKLDEFNEQYQEADEEQLQWDASDELDIAYKFDARFSQGWSRKIWLRDGIKLYISQMQNKDRLIIYDPELQDYDVEFNFWLSGNEQWKIPSALNETSWTCTAGKYLLASTGSRNKLIIDYDTKPWSRISLYVNRIVLRSFAVSPEKELPKHLRHLIIPIDQEIYRRVKDIQPAMAGVLQQILNCPYQGMVKRAYLESKVIELMALVLDHEIIIQQGEVKKGSLKPDQIERIHYAKEILLRDLSNPPSLEELAHQAGLNDFMLKQGFHHCFGTTVFSVLRDRRLEMARQMLAEQEITVAEVAHQIGYASVRAFARAFKKRFGSSPKAYQKSSQK